MAKIRVPLVSLGADGRVGRHLVYTTRKGQTIVRSRARVPDQRTNLQLAQRSWFQDCIAAWRELTDTQKLEYAAVDPKAWPNPAYQNFMREWLVGTVPVHAPDHSHGDRDPVSLEDLESSQVGVSDEPQLNFVPKVHTGALLDLGAQSDIAWTNIDLSAIVGATAVAVVLGIDILDTGGPDAGLQLRHPDHASWFEWHTVLAQVANVYCKEEIICELDANRILQYRLIASGINTASTRIILFGYFEPSEV